MTNIVRYQRAQSCSGGPARPCRGFTLVELLVVLVIIGILLGLILTASVDGIRRAEERATQALIIKLDTAISDRMEALAQETLRPSPGHYILAWIYNGSIPLPDEVNLPVRERYFNFFQNRAQVLARYDFFKREMPDVFFRDQGFMNNPTSYGGPYPLNFAGNPYPTGGTFPADFVLPLGAGWIIDPTSGNPVFSPGEGIFGASYAAAAGVYKQLGYLPAGYDGVDNTGEGLIDEWAEGVDATNHDQVVSNLLAHKHKTARAEMLYALLVEGRGPFGSVFNKEDFTEKEVRDTDGDGLLEFVDAWGEPLQFYRWPLLYSSNYQKGQVIGPQASTGARPLLPPYAAVTDLREQDPLDASQLTLAPSWWSATNAGPTGWTYTPPLPALAGTNAGFGALSFEYFFHRLHEPLENPGGIGQYWDRGSATGLYLYRRSFFSRPLVISSGLDRELGIYRYPDDSEPRTSGALPYLAVENNAMPFFFDFTGGAYIPAGSAVIPLSSGDMSYELQEAGQDDISNHNTQAGDAGS